MKKALPWLISFGIAIAGCAGISAWQCSFLGSDAAGLTSGISNGCFAVAVAFIGIALLMFVASFGGFDGLRYLVYTLRFKWSRHKKGKETLESYYDFQAKRAAKAKDGSRHISLPVLIAGLAALAVAAVFMLINLKL